MIAEEMAAVPRPRPVSMAQRPPTVGSWDDLMKRRRSRADTMGQGVFSENDARKRPQSSGGGDAPISARANGRADERPQSSGSGGGDSVLRGTAATGNHVNGTATRPVIRPRTMTYQPDQRTSQAFAAHVAALNNVIPSPLRTVRSSDSLPEMSSHVTSSSEANRYSTIDSPQATEKGPIRRPQMYARPQRLTSPTKLAEMNENRRSEPFQPFDSIANGQGRMRAMSWGPMSAEQEAFSSSPSAFAQPTYSYRQSGSSWQRRPEMIKQVRVQRPGPNEVFTKLPDEVLRMILDHLKVLHLEERSTSCATCWMRDCCSITVCNRRLLYAARAVLYDEIQLVGPDSAVQRKKYKGVYSTRLVLLRRTLRSNPKIASTVRALKVPALADEAPLEPESYHDIVASVVMACPNLERLQGFYPTYNHSDSRIFQALSTRTKLKEMTWVVDAEPTEPEGQQQARLSKIKGRPQSRHASYSMGSGRPSHSLNYLPVQLANNFVRQHMEWTELSHLTIHCLPGANLYTPNDLLGVIVTYLPSLQSLYLSDIPAVSFNDSTLLALPKPLKRLGLVRCAGVTTAGLTTFATHDSAKELETLTLIHQNVDSLPAIVRIFSNLSNLTTFSLVQTLAPTPDDDFFCFMPYVASQSLKMLHWDIFESGLNTADRNGEGAGTSGPTRADALLARSIAANGFPNLRFLRTPCDTGGLFQALCRPKERVELLGDRFRTGLINQASSTTPGGTRPSHRSVNSFSSSSKAIDPSAVYDLDGRLSSDTKDSGKAFGGAGREAGSDLHQARLAAQARLEAARRLPRIEVNIQDEDGVIIESSGLAAYIGDVTSRITYLLTPDHGGTDERGGLVGVAELLSDGGEDLCKKGDVASRSGAGYGTGCVAGASCGGAGLEGREKVKKSNSSKSIKDGSAGEATKVIDGCTGRWNSYNCDRSASAKSSEDAWWHTERGRWKNPSQLS